MSLSALKNDFEVCCSAPSNIAFLKYWGKKDAKNQIPAGPSFSMTLEKCRSQTKAVVLNPSADEHVVELNGQMLIRSSQLKLFKHLDRLKDLFPKQKNYLGLSSQNLFPTGAGIASSASGYAALTVAGIAAFERVTSLEDLFSRGWSLDRLADLARLGSGSACRSLHGGYIVWDTQPDHQQLIYQTHQHDQWDLADTVVLVSKQEKQTPSSVAHQAAWGSPFFRPRLAGLHERMHQMVAAVENKDLSALGPLLETDANEMHAIIHTGVPSVGYITDQSIEVMIWVRSMRQQKMLNAYYTIDAGANIHLICELEQQRLLAQMLGERFPEYELILDRVGSGIRLSSAVRL